jgi:hypothetical protein
MSCSIGGVQIGQLTATRAGSFIFSSPYRISGVSLDMSWCMSSESRPNIEHFSEAADLIAKNPTMLPHFHQRTPYFHAWR